MGREREGDKGRDKEIFIEIGCAGLEMKHSQTFLNNTLPFIFHMGQGIIIKTNFTKLQPTKINKRSPGLNHLRAGTMIQS